MENEITNLNDDTRKFATEIKTVTPTQELTVSVGRLKIVNEQGSLGKGTKIYMDGEEVQNVVSVELGKITVDELITCKLEMYVY